MAVIDIYNTNNKYSVIYTDPPWKQQKGNLRKCRPNQGKAFDYPVLGMDEITEIHQHVFENLCSPAHNVFMWTIDKYLQETEWMMAGLGYKLHARMVWDKQNGPAPAFTVRFSHEYLLWFYRKGRIFMPCEQFRGVYATVISEPSVKHSKKPVTAYEMLENMFPGTKKLEMFARNKRRGWDCWGNEV